MCTTEQSRREDRLGAGDQMGAFTPPHTHPHHCRGTRGGAPALGGPGPIPPRQEGLGASLCSRGVNSKSLNYTEGELFPKEWKQLGKSDLEMQRKEANRIKSLCFKYHVLISLTLPS